MIKQKRAEHFWGYLLIFPTVAGLIVLNIYPIIRSIWQSFHEAGRFGIGNVFIGFGNYVRMFNDSDVWQSLANTLIYTAVEVPFSIVLALLFAVFLNRKIKGRTVFRTIFFIPMVTAPAAIAMVWRWLFNSRFGLINNVFGLDIAWISDPNIAIFSLAIIGIWAALGYNLILILAGLQDVPKDFYEAATIDGASAFRQLIHITIPMISPVLFFVAVTRTIAALQLFDLVYMIMELHNPAFPRTQSLVYMFFRYSFDMAQWGYGATLVVLLLFVIGFITIIQLIAQKRWVHYE